MVTRVKRRIFSGCVCEQEIYSVPIRISEPRKAEPRPRFASEEERKQHRIGISRRKHAQIFNENFSPSSLYSTLTMDNESEVHTFTEARRIRDNFVRCLKHHEPDAKIMIYTGRGKHTQRIHFHMVSEGVPEELIRNKWKFGNVLRIEHLREHNYYNNAIAYPVYDENGRLSAIYPINATRFELLEYMGVMYCRFQFATGRSYICEYSRLIHIRRHFDHNSGYEGGNRIHFQFGKTAVSSGTDVCFIDSRNNTTGSSSAFRMNTTNTNSGGWSGSYMRQTICGTSLTSYSGTFIAVLPSDLRSVLKTVTKYTDNTGNKTTAASAVTATTDVIFLLSEWEVFGARTYANSAEKNYQAQYDYYSAGNSKVKYQHTSIDSANGWFLRSTNSSATSTFVSVSTNGSAGVDSAYTSRGFAPGFCV